MEEATSIRSLMGDPKKIVLVDASWLLHRSLHSHGSLSANVGGVTVPTGDIYGFVSTVGNLSRRFPDASVILCLDSKTNERRASCPRYKANRDGNAGVYLKLPECLTACSVLPSVYISMAEGLEADDVIFTLAHKFSSHFPVLIFSVDKDLWQAVGTRVRIFSSIKEVKGPDWPYQTLGLEHCAETWGVLPRKVAFLRSFSGDTSDNLEGYPRFPTKLAKSLALAFEDPKALVEWGEGSRDPSVFCPGHGEEKWIEEVIANPSILVENYNLMRLREREEVRLFREVGSWEPFQKYQMKATTTQFEDLVNNVTP